MQTKHRFQARIVIARKTDLKSQSKTEKNQKTVSKAKLRGHHDMKNTINSSGR